MTGTKKEILKRLQADLPDGKLIMVTYWTEDDVREEADNLGVDIEDRIDDVFSELYDRVSDNEEIYCIIQDF